MHFDSSKADKKGFTPKNGIVNLCLFLESTKRAIDKALYLLGHIVASR